MNTYMKKLLHLYAQCGNSSVGRASASQAEGRGFEPRFPLKSRPDDAKASSFFCAMTDRCMPSLHKGWNGAKNCAQHNGLLLEAPAASGTGMPEAKPRFPIQTRPFPYNLSGKNISKNSSAKHLPYQPPICALDEVLFWKVQQFCCTFHIDILCMPCRALFYGR